VENRDDRSMSETNVNTVAAGAATPVVTVTVGQSAYFIGCSVRQLDSRSGS
jgi:hypothetical protein